MHLHIFTRTQRSWAHLHIFTLLTYLKLIRVDDLAGSIDEVVDVYAAGEFCEVDGCLFLHILLFEYFFAKETIYLQGQSFLVPALDLEVDIRGRRVRIEPDYFGLTTSRRRRLCLGRSSRKQYDK